jgi:hypothetical protein
MNTTILIIAILYIAFTSMVLLTFRSMRDRGIGENEYYDNEEQAIDTGMLVLQN